jgi:hypothetical protein
MTHCALDPVNCKAGNSEGLELNCLSCHEDAGGETGKIGASLALVRVQSGLRAFNMKYRKPGGARQPWWKTTIFLLRRRGQLRRSSASPGLVVSVRFAGRVG